MEDPARYDNLYPRSRQRGWTSVCQSSSWSRRERTCTRLRPSRTAKETRLVERCLLFLFFFRRQKEESAITPTSVGVFDSFISKKGLCACEFFGKKSDMWLLSCSLFRSRVCEEEEETAKRRTLAKFKCQWGICARQSCQRRRREVKEGGGRTQRNRESGRREVEKREKKQKKRNRWLKNYKKNREK